MPPSTSILPYGGEKRGKVTEFKEIRGYILVRKPNMLRMIGLYPIVRNKAFDMVSDGHEFKLLVPATNKFYIGHNEAIEDSDRIRWTRFARRRSTTRSCCRPVNPENEIAVMESSTEMVVDAQTTQAGASSRTMCWTSSGDRQGLDAGAKSHVRSHQPGATSSDHL